MLHIFNNGNVRNVGLRAGMPVFMPAVTLNRLCGSDFEAIAQGAQQVLVGDSKVLLTSGSESMSQAPFAVRGTRFGSQLGAKIECEDVLWQGLTDSRVGMPMGITAENLGAKYKVTREESDAFATRTQQCPILVNTLGLRASRFDVVARRFLRRTLKDSQVKPALGDVRITAKDLISSNISEEMAKIAKNIAEESGKFQVTFYVAFFASLFVVVVFVAGSMIKLIMYGSEFSTALKHIDETSVKETEFNELKTEFTGLKGLVTGQLAFIAEAVLQKPPPKAKSPQKQNNGIEAPASSFSKGKAPSPVEKNCSSEEEDKE